MTVGAVVGARYGMAVFDLDGTLTDSSKKVTAASRRELFRVMDAGVKVVLASGRPAYGIAPVADVLELERRGGYVLAFNGGSIIDWRTKEELYAVTLRPDVLPVICDFARRSGVALLTYRGCNILTEKPDDEYVHIEAGINNMTVIGVPDFLKAVDFAPEKCLIAGPPPILASLETEIQAALSDRMAVYRSAPYFLELVPRGIDKATSLARLTSLLGLSAANVIAFGDGFNDLSMLRFSGMGVAMGNAVPEVRAAADYVTAGNDEEGVATALCRFFPSL